MMVVLGDSHAGPLGQALGRGKASPSVAALKGRFGRIAVSKVLPGWRLRAPFFEVDRDAIRLRGEAGEMAAGLAGSDGGIRAGDGHVYGFSMGFHTAIFLRQQYWSEFTLLPQVSEKAYVSEAAYREMVLGDNAWVLEFARLLREREVDAFFIAAAPIRTAMIERQAKCAGRDELLTIHRRYLAVMEAALSSIGMPYVAAPEAATEGGVLKPEYDSAVEDDPHHGNVRFGRLQWDAIAAYWGVTEGAA